MAVSMQELASARETVRDLLEQMELEAYVFEVEPKDPDWQIRLDCGLGEQWQSVILDVDHERLMASKESDQARKELLAIWQKQLKACDRAGQKKAR